jgi:hypothetical protein
MGKPMKLARRGARKPRAVKKTTQKKKRSGLARRELPGFQQGVGEVSAPRFGSCDLGRVNYGFDANHPAHLPLPLQTGPYMVMRVTTKIAAVDAKPVMMFGTFRTRFQDNRVTEAGGIVSIGRQQFKDGWSSICAVGGDVGQVVANSSTKWFPQPLAELGDSATITPAAMSLQIMNSAALQSSSGIVYAARLKTQFRGQDEDRTWGSLGDQMVSFMQPRLLSAGKIALRGVKIDSVPLNTFELQDFDQMLDPGPFLEEQPFTPYLSNWRSEATAPMEPNIVQSSKGFAPIVVYNPDSVGLEYLVTTEYRVRFDIGHPAASTHKLHAPSSQNEWSTAIARVMATGHGVLDIVESVSALGERAYKVLAPMF